MKRFAIVVPALLLFAGVARAQNLDNENDLPLCKGIDIIYGYQDPSVGSPVGTFPPDWANSDYFWKVIPKEVLRHCSGTMEVSGMDFFTFDTDYTTVDVNGNNTLLHDIVFTVGIPSGTNPGQIEPDPTDPNLVQLSFGAGSPNNASLPDPGCPPAGFINGYQLDVSIAGGVVGAGIILTADGTTDYVVTHMIPSGMCSGGACPGTGACLDGDMTFQDAHSSCNFGGIGETQADWLGSGYSAFGGFAIGGALGGTDAVCETPWTNLEFFERTLNMRVDSGTGNGPELGLAGLNFSLGASGGGFASIGARYFSYQGVGNLAAVAGSILPPLPVCLPFGTGSGLAINPSQPLFNLFITFWKGPVVLDDFTDTGASTGAVGDPFDDGALTTIQLGPLAPFIPPGVTMYFQGLEKAGGIHTSQLNRITFNP